MKNTYIKTTWVDNKTPINAANMNKIEDSLYNLTSSSVSYSDIKGSDNIDVTLDEKKNINISAKGLVSSATCSGIEFITTEPSTYEEDKMYLLIDPDTKKLKKIIFNGVSIYEVE